MPDSSQQLELANEIKTRVPAPRLGSEFNAFLFSPIGDDRNGMPLSVVSLLARCDLDPWQEAASLAVMPTSAATRRLDSLIRALPDQSLTLPDSGTVASRLIALLPPRIDPKMQGPGSHAKTHDAAALATSRRTTVVAMIVVVSMMIMLMGAQLARLSNEPPAQAVAVNTPPAPVPPPRTPPPTIEK
jgi:hypothetical protein